MYSRLLIFGEHTTHISPAMSTKRRLLSHINKIADSPFGYATGLSELPTTIKS